MNLKKTHNRVCNVRVESQRTFFWLFQRRNSDWKFCLYGGKREKSATWKHLQPLFDCNILTGVFVSKWHHFILSGRWKHDVQSQRMNSDGVVLISQLSKSCSCGIKTDTVPVSDLGGKKKMIKEIINSGLYWFYLAWPWSGSREARSGEMVSRDIISLLFTQESRELKESWVSQATFFFTSFSWSEDHGIKEGLVATWDLCDWLIYCGDGRSFIYGNI